MERIRNTNMVYARSISLFTVTSLLSLLLLFHVLGGAEISKDVEALDNNNDNTTYFASNNTYTSKPCVLYSKIDGKGVVILRGAVIDGTGSIPKPNAVVTPSENMLNMLLGYGVTTIRNPGGPTEQSVALKKDVTAGKIKGPTIFTAGRLIKSGKPISFTER